MEIWANKSVGTFYPITQVPASKSKLPNFAWFDNIRPKDKNDIFVWRGKGQEHELKTIKRHAAPLQTLSSKESQQGEQPMGQVDKLKEKDNKPKEHE